MPRQPEEEFWKAAAILANGLHSQQYQGVLISAPSRREGTTTVTLQIAHALSTKCDVRPLVVELNFWKPVLVKKLHLDPNRTLHRVLAGEIRLSEAVQKLESGVGVLAASDRRNPPAKHLCPLVSEIMRHAASRWDFVLVDSPPLTQHSAILSVGAVIPKLLLVVRAGASSTRAIARFRQEVHNVGIEVFGTILNRERRFVPNWMERAFLS